MILSRTALGVGENYVVSVILCDGNYEKRL